MDKTAKITITSSGIDWSDVMDRPGKVRVSPELFHKIPKAVQAIMGVMLITRAEVMFPDDTIVYHGVSPLFPRSERGYVAPYYVFTLNQKEDGSIEVELDREDVADTLPEIKRVVIYQE